MKLKKLGKMLLPLFNYIVTSSFTEEEEGEICPWVSHYLSP